MNIDSLLQSLWHASHLSATPEVYAVVDAARDARVLALLREGSLPHDCLYEGPVSRELLDVAPYLVSLRPEERSTRVLLENAWGRAWGIFLS